MEKRFSTVRDTWRDSKSYMEKRRGRREIEVTKRRREGIKSGERSLVSNKFPMCSPQSGTLRKVHGVTQRREKGGRRRRKVTSRKRGGVKRRETDLVSNQFPKCSPQPGTPKEIHRVGYRREGGGRSRGDLGEKKESQKGRGQSSQ